MICARPWHEGSSELPCGVCAPCRVNRRRIWQTRLMLEASVSEASSFVTLTYDDDHLPGDGCVDRRDPQLFLKRLRQTVKPRKVRYYLVGEYGDVSLRPHYHLAMFGVGVEDQGVLERCWGNGFVHIGSLTVQSAGYVLGYMDKAATKKGDPRLKGLRPEFASMSLRPVGLGGGAVSALSDAAMGLGGAVSLANSGDVTSVVRQGGKLWPLGRYLRAKLRVALGRSEKVPSVVSLSRSLEYWKDVSLFDGLRKRLLRRVASEQSAEARLRISRSRRSI